MMVASMESTLEFWASSLRDVKARMRPLFSQERVALSAYQFLDGLLGDERRKTGWMPLPLVARIGGGSFTLVFGFENLLCSVETLACTS